LKLAASGWRPVKLAGLTTVKYFFSDINGYGGGFLLVAELGEMKRFY